MGRLTRKEKSIKATLLSLSVLFIAFTSYYTFPFWVGESAPALVDAFSFTIYDAIIGMTVIFTLSYIVDTVMG